MKFQAPRPQENLANLGRLLGYRLFNNLFNSELNLVRPLGQDYPRFHVYLKEDGPNLLFNLHLDQKRPSYGQETAHSGEYEGELVEGEKQRIEQVLAKLTT